MENMIWTSGAYSAGSIAISAMARRRYSRYSTRYRAVIRKCYKGHRAAEFLDFLKRIDAEMPDVPVAQYEESTPWLLRKSLLSFG